MLTKSTVINTYASGNVLILIRSGCFGNLDIDYDITPPESSEEMEKYHTIVTDSEADFEQMKTKKVIFLKDGTWRLQDNGQKTFVFIVGTIGSGKSALIRKIRSLINMSGGIFIAQIDKLIESDIEFITNPDTETYWKLRKDIYNEHMDQLIGQSILQSNSIILETTNVNPQYIDWIKSYGYSVVVAVVEEAYETICENIKIRNQTKIRKTNLSREDYDAFIANIPTYTKSADQVFYIRPNIE
jgi:hypothetical protein